MTKNDKYLVFILPLTTHFTSLSPEVLLILLPVTPEKNLDLTWSVSTAFMIHVEGGKLSASLVPFSLLAVLAGYLSCHPNKSQ